MIDALIEFFEQDGWEIHHGSGSRENDDVIAEMRDYDIVTVNLTKLDDLLCLFSKNQHQGA
jgi:hypothetical protein